MFCSTEGGGWADFPQNFLGSDVDLAGRSARLSKAASVALEDSSDSEDGSACHHNSYHP